MFLTGPLTTRRHPLQTYIKKDVYPLIAAVVVGVSYGIYKGVEHIMVGLNLFFLLPVVKLTPASLSYLATAYRQIQKRTLTLRAGIPSCDTLMKRFVDIYVIKLVSWDH